MKKTLMFVVALVACSKHKAKEQGCGEVDVDGSKVPLDCFEPGELDVSDASRKAVKLAARLLPKIVDHRADGTEGPVRRQGLVGDCTAASLAAVIDHALIRTSDGSAPPVSLLHIWSHYHVPGMGAGAAANRGKNLAAEQSWPYSDELACSWLPSCKNYPDAKAPPDPALVANADAHGAAFVVDITRLDNNPVELMGALAGGQDLWIGMRVGAPFANKNLIARPWGKTIGDYPKPAKGGGHAVDLAGYRVEEDGTYYLIHNSFGATWGDAGYAWIGEKTLFDNLEVVYVVEAVPASKAREVEQPATPPGTLPATQLAAKRPHHRVVIALRGTRTCPTGQVPDAQSQLCAAPCDGGGPPISGVCPSRADCPDGEVEVAGSCVAAAPVGAGADAFSSWQCSAGACVYSLKNGAQRSCPAPKYVLTIGPRGESCSE
jgi:hypothetical protein